MNSIRFAIIPLGVSPVLSLLAAAGSAAPLPQEMPLWPETGWENAIQYDVPEAVRAHEPGKGSLSGSNRVYSFVSKPTYSIHQPPNGKGDGVGLVICPGGGFRELWMDREGHDLALWLKERGVTSLVLKYRTNAEVENGKRKYAAEVYEPAVTADARQAIRILRSQATALHLDPARIGSAASPPEALCRPMPYSALKRTLTPPKQAASPTSAVCSIPDFGMSILRKLPVGKRSRRCLS